MRKLLTALVLAAGVALVGSAQITIPNSFTTNTVADPDQVNTNFSTLGSQALNRTGGTMTGTINSQAITPTVDATYALGTAPLRFTNGVFSGIVTVGSGAAGAPSLAVGAATGGIYSSGSNALDFSTNSIKALGIDSTQFVDSPTQPRASAITVAAAQSLADSAWTAVLLNGEDFDVSAMHDNVTNRSRLTVPTGGDGLYLAIANVTFDANATGSRGIRFAKNGTVVTGTTTVVLNTGAGITPQVGTMAVLVLAAADYLEAQAFQSSGGALNISNSELSRAVIVKLW
jgi:hypothetical protein